MASCNLLEGTLPNYIMSDLRVLDLSGVTRSSRGCHEHPGPQNELPGIPWTKGFCGNSTETLIFWNFPAHPDFGFWGPHF